MCFCFLFEINRHCRRKNYTTYCFPRPTISNKCYCGRMYVCVCVFFLGGCPRVHVHTWSVGKHPTFEFCPLLTYHINWSRYSCTLFSFGKLKRRKEKSRRGKYQQKKKYNRRLSQPRINMFVVSILYICIFSRVQCSFFPGVKWVIKGIRFLSPVLLTDNKMRMLFFVI